MSDFIKCDSGYFNIKTDMDQIISEIKELIDNGNIGSAEDFIKNIFSMEPVYNCDIPGNMADRIFSFDEPIEEEYFKYKHNVTQELNHEPYIRTELFLMYAYILIERKNYDEALNILNRGIMFNPVSTALMNEKAEIYKMKGQWDTFKDIIDECYDCSYKCEQLSRVYRDYGYMLIEKEDYEGAICAYIVSLVYQDNDISKNELNYIASKVDKSIDADCYFSNAADILKQRGIKLGPNEDICELAYAYAKHFEDLKDYPVAFYYYERLYELTDNDEAKEKSEKLGDMLFGSTNS